MNINDLLKGFNMDEFLKLFEDFRKIVAKLNEILNPTPTPKPPDPGPGPGPDPEPEPEPEPKPEPLA
jgi:hypothetical protein